MKKLSEVKLFKNILGDSMSFCDDVISEEVRKVLREWAIEHIKELFGDGPVKEILQSMFEITEEDLL